MSVTARVAVAPPLELTPSEMTERQRRVVERGVRRRLIAVAFGDGAVASSEMGAPDKLDAAVVEAVTALGRSRSEGLSSRLVALLDLLELDGRHVPFDAQTRFYDAFLATDPSPPMADPVFAAIAQRLGFAVATPD